MVTGRIGSGKTTLLRALLGLLPKQKGEIRWNGRMIEDPASFFVPPRSAYTSQVPLLFSESLKENILMGIPEDKVDLNPRFAAICAVDWIASGDAEAMKSAKAEVGALDALVEKEKEKTLTMRIAEEVKRLAVKLQRS